MRVANLDLLTADGAQAGRVCRRRTHRYGHKLVTPAAAPVALCSLKVGPGRYSQPPWPGPELRAGQADQTPGNRPRPNRLFPIEAKPGGRDPYSLPLFFCPDPAPPTRAPRRRPELMAVSLAVEADGIARLRPLPCQEFRMTLRPCPWPYNALLTMLVIPIRWRGVMLFLAGTAGLAHRTLAR
jgi:hypothetical protein